MDFYRKLTFKVQKGRGLGSRNRISTFWDPLITFGWIELSASNLVQTEDGSYMRTDYKTIPKWAWPWSRDCDVTQFRNFGTLFNFRTNRAIRFKFGADIEDVPPAYRL